MTVVRDQLFFPQKPPGSRFRFSRTGVQPSSGLSTIELPSAFAESGAYPPDGELPGSPRQCSLPLACRHPPEGHQIGAGKRRTPENIATTEETTVTQQVSHNRSIKCQSRLWSQIGTKVNGSHHGDKPLLRPTWIQIATKRQVTVQAMTPTNIKTVGKTRNGLSNLLTLIYRELKLHHYWDTFVLVFTTTTY